MHHHRFITRGLHTKGNETSAPSVWEFSAFLHWSSLTMDCFYVKKSSFLQSWIWWESQNYRHLFELNIWIFGSPQQCVCACLHVCVCVCMCVCTQFHGNPLGCTETKITDISVTEVSGIRSLWIVCTTFKPTHWTTQNRIQHSEAVDCW